MVRRLRVGSVRRLVIAVLAGAVVSAVAPAHAAGEGAARKLMMLIVERLQLMPGVAMNKWNSGAAVEDLPREAVVIEAAMQAGGALGLDKAFAGRFMRAQIEAAKVVQSGLLLRWSEARQPPFAAPPDLATAIRPALDRLTPALLSALPQVLSELGQNGAAELVAGAADAPSELKPALAVALTPLIEAARRKP